MDEKLIKISALPPVERWGEALKTDEGTHCSNCEYLKDAEKMICGNEGFIAWEGPNKPAGSDKIPATDPKKYCSIWWEYDDDGERAESEDEEYGGAYKYRRLGKEKL